MYCRIVTVQTFDTTFPLYTELSHFTEDPPLLPMQTLNSSALPRFGHAWAVIFGCLERYDESMRNAVTFQIVKMCYISDSFQS